MAPWLSTIDAMLIRTFMLRSQWPTRSLSPILGLNFWRIQLLLLGIAAVVSGLYWLLQGNVNPTPQVLSTLIIGNCNWLAAVLAVRVFAKQKSPWDLLAYLAVLLPVAALASFIASVASRMVARRSGHLFQLEWADIRIGTFFSLVAGVAFFVAGRQRARLERRNRELETQITIGQFKLQAHEAELKAAHEIQGRTCCLANCPI